MSKISASQVNELRKKTGAGMMDCKKALVEAEGDMEKAVEVLRKRGQKVAAKREDRDATEGYVIAKTNDNNTTGVVLCLSCETDFVAKNADFIGFATKLIDMALENNLTNPAGLLSMEFQAGMTVAEKIIEQTGVIGEKIEIGALELLNGEGVVEYNHPGNRLATLIQLNKTGENVLEAGRQVAMQAAAMAPIALSEGDVDENTKNKEIEIGKELAMKEGKPAEMAEKIAIGRLGKFFKENTLLKQAFIRDNKLDVAGFLNQTEKGLTATDFKRVSLG
ncbi:MAG: elongation factor Ts [Sphingobacteriales bacterium]|jgi:elongation factor Ts